MSTVTVRPTGTVAPDSSVITGAATAHAATNDNSDASYINKARYAPAVRLTFASPTKPANSVTKSLQVRVRRSSQSAGLTKLNFWAVRTGSGELGRSQTTAAGTSAATASGVMFTDGDLSQALLDSLQAHCQVDASSSADARIYEVYLDVTFAEQPTVTADATVDGTSTTVTWAHTAGTDGGPQAWYRAWLTADVGGATVYDTGLVYGSATSATATGLTSASYTWHVQTASEIHTGQGHWTAEVTDAAVIPPQTRAEVDTIVATPDPLQAVVEVQVEIDPAQDTATSVEIERSADRDVLGGIGSFTAGTGGIGTGWVAGQTGTPTTGSRSLETTGGISGQYQRMAATLDDGDAYWIDTPAPYFAVDPTLPHQLSLVARGTFPTGTRLRIYQTYRTGDGSLTAGSSWIAWSDFVPSADWMPYETAIVPPLDAATIAVRVDIVGITGASAAATSVDIDALRVTEVVDGWLPLRVVPTPSSDSLTAYDFEAPPNTLVYYRARAENAAGAVGSWVYADPVEWEAEDAVWFKPLGRPDLTMQLCLAERPTLTRPRQQAVMTILGSEHRVVRADVLNSTEWDLLVETETAADAAAFLALLKSNSSILLQFPTEYDMLGPHMWVSVLDVQEAFQSPVLGVYYRVWQLRVVEIGTP